jgi:hypothetical protein
MPGQFSVEINSNELFEELRKMMAQYVRNRRSPDKDRRGG